MEPKNHTKSFKAKVVIAAIKSQKTTNEIASEFGVHVSQVNRWKKKAIDALPEVFGSKKDTTIQNMASERDHLFQQI